jgi:hypothetical protein
MIEAAEWQKNNEAYLKAACNWLRLCLTSLAPPPPIIIKNEPPTVVSQQPVEEGNWSIFRRHKPLIEVPKPIAQIGASIDGVNLLHVEIEEAAAELDEAAKAEPPPALVILTERLGLSRFEQEILLLCASVELDTRIAALCARAQDDASKPYPTFALAMAMFAEPTWDALSPQHPLRYLRLIEVNQPAAQPLTASALRVDERILNFIKGLNEFDDRLAPLLVAVDAPDMDLPPSQQLIAGAILRNIRQSAANIFAGRIPLIELTGIDSSSKQFIAAVVADALQFRLYRMPAEVLPANAAELETLTRLWQREALLKPVALYIDASDLTIESPAFAAIRRFCKQCPGLAFLDTRLAWNIASDDVVVADVASPTPAEQKKVWIAKLSAVSDNAPESESTEDKSDETETVETTDDGIKTGEISADEIDFFAALLANQFNLSLPAIHRIAQNSLTYQSAETSPLDAVWEMCLSNSRPRLDALAQRIDAKATRSDIVLPVEETTLLAQIVEQVKHRGTVYDDWGFRERMNRGLGISALFAGESGTGKTMAAEVIASELNLNLYRIDLSSVVSKYIGDTERNLRQVFDAAEAGSAILFFDEADALFGRRSEVKDSHDRYANIEINYLLQRLESFGGLAILASNMKSALDTAFMRRLRFIVNFPFPGRTEREKIWQKVFPPATPKDALDYERLARFNLSGGSINNIALNAAFMATNQKPPRVTMRLIFDAVRTEFRKLGLPVNETDFALSSN